MSSQSAVPLLSSPAILQPWLGQPMLFWCLGRARMRRGARLCLLHLSRDTFLQLTPIPFPHGSTQDPSWKQRQEVPLCGDVLSSVVLSILCRSLGEVQ